MEIPYAAAQGRSMLGRFGLALVVVVVVFIASTATRIMLFSLFDVARGNIVWDLRAFGAGAVFDTLVALWVGAPVVAYMIVASTRRYSSRSSRVARRGTLAAVIALAVFVLAAEYLFFDEFDGRFNFVAVDYLVYPTEVVTNIWQSYPLGWAIAGIGAITVVLMVFLRRIMARLDLQDGPPLRARLMFGAGYVTMLATMSWFVSPALAHVTDDRVLNEIASNGYYTFIQAALGRDAPYVGLYAARPVSAVLAQLHAIRASAPPPRLLDAQRYNVVIVLEESLGSAFITSLRSRDSLPITPAFDSLIAQGRLFTRAYSTGNRTVRAIEATTASIPPLPGISIVRRPASVGLLTLPAVLRERGYATEFIYGGRALFDGMGSYAMANGFERVYEQKHFPRGTFATAWGVADEFTFDAALAQMDSLHALGKPFCVTILTVSNHKPYTYPVGRIPLDPNAHKRNYAVRYADYSLGRFMQGVSAKPYYSNTLFVIMGDHGARVYGAAEIPLPSYEVPILFFMPGKIAPGVRSNVIASSLDIPPTVLRSLGMPVDSLWFGHDLFAIDSSRGRALMTHNSDLALLRDDRMVVLGLHGATTVYTRMPGGGMTRVVTPDSASRALIEEAIAYYYGADYLYRRGALKLDAAHQPPE